MAYIEKRTSSDGEETSYRVQIRKKGFPLETATFKKLTDAKAWAATKEAEMKEGRYFKVSKAKQHTLADVIERYARQVRTHSKDPDKTLMQLEWWRQAIGVMTLDQVTPEVIANQRDHLLAKPIHGRKVETFRSGPTVNRYLAALSGALTFCVKELGWLDNNPVHRVKKYKESSGREVFLTPEQVATVLQTAQQMARKDFYVYLLLSLTTGARAGEIEHLRWSQVNLDSGVIRLHDADTKNGSGRNLHLIPDAIEVLRDYGKVRHIGTDLVFPKLSKPDEAVEFDHCWRSLRKQLPGLEQVRRHDLRHTVGSFVAMTGGSLRDITEVLGHKTLAMAKRYSHLLDEHTAAVTNRAADAILAKVNGASEQKKTS